MHVTIVRADNIVIVDGVSATVDCSGLSAHVHAVHWADTEGWIEFAPDADGRLGPNTKIVDFSPYKFLFERWRLAMREKLTTKKEATVEAAETELAQERGLREQKALLAHAEENVQRALKQAREEKEAHAAQMQRLLDQQTGLDVRLAQAQAELAELKKRDMNA